MPAILDDFDDHHVLKIMKNRQKRIKREEGGNNDIMHAKTRWYFIIKCCILPDYETVSDIFYSHIYILLMIVWGYSSFSLPSQLPFVYSRHSAKDGIPNKLARLSCLCLISFDGERIDQKFPWPLQRMVYLKYLWENLVKKNNGVSFDWNRPKPKKIAKASNISKCRFIC